jgi:hypothetical protein
MLTRGEGIILVTGPTGSGKTTTLYSFLQRLNEPDRNIITIEDPVELRMGGITQINANTRAGMTFASALRSVLRQDPDVVMVGEMRDQETAEIAVRAALTGHLVLSTLHTNSAAATLGRLIDMGIERFLLSDTVIGIVSQRLVRSLCANCSEPDPDGMEAIAHWRADVPETANIRRARGCTACGNTGFRGRIAVEEVLFLNGQLRRMIRAGESENDLEEAAVRTGMIRMKDAALQRVVDGKTTLDEIRGILSSEESGTAVVPGTHETPANEKESETEIVTEPVEDLPSGLNFPESISQRDAAPSRQVENVYEQAHLVAASVNGHSNAYQNERHGDPPNPHFFEPHGVDNLENGHSLDIESVIQQVERPETNYALSAKWGFHATTTSDAMEEAEHHQWIP